MKIIFALFLLAINLTLDAQTFEDCSKLLIKKEKEIEVKDSMINSRTKLANGYLDSINKLNGLIKNYSAWKYKYDTLAANASKVIQQKEDSVKKPTSAEVHGINKDLTEANDLLKIKRSLDSLYLLPIDSIVKRINVTTFNRDKIWLNHNPQLKNSLQYIFEGQQCLKEKYNAEAINQSVKRLKTIEQTHVVKNLIKSLQDYNAVNESLKKAIQEVIVMEKDGYDKALGDRVFRKQMPPLLVFIYQQRCTYDEFPYLFNLVVEAINIKGSDQGKSISSLLSKL
jgi:hypothetical protein